MLQPGIHTKYILMFYLQFINWFFALKSSEKATRPALTKIRRDRFPHGLKLQPGGSSAGKENLFSPYFHILL